MGRSGMRFKDRYPPLFFFVFYFFHVQDYIHHMCWDFLTTYHLQAVLKIFFQEEAIRQGVAAILFYKLRKCIISGTQHFVLVCEVVICPIHSLAHWSSNEHFHQSCCLQMGVMSNSE